VEWRPARAGAVPGRGGRACPSRPRSARAPGWRSPSRKRVAAAARGFGNASRRGSLDS